LRGNSKEKERELREEAKVSRIASRKAACQSLEWSGILVMEDLL
jgi:hypothetical protein